MITYRQTTEQILVVLRAREERLAKQIQQLHEEIGSVAAQRQQTANAIIALSAALVSYEAIEPVILNGTPNLPAVVTIRVASTASTTPQETNIRHIGDETAPPISGMPDATAADVADVTAIEQPVTETLTTVAADDGLPAEARPYAGLSWKQRVLRYAQDHSGIVDVNEMASWMHHWGIATSKGIISTIYGTISKSGEFDRVQPGIYRLRVRQNSNG